MRHLKTFLFLLATFLFFSCGEKSKNEQQTVEKLATNTTPVKHSNIIYLDQGSINKIENWSEYQNLNNFIDQFQNISSTDAINNSRELNDLVKNLHDSIKPKFLETPAFKARVNLLRNESMRLYDMSSISSIKIEEINEQVSKLLIAYSSMNSKINMSVRRGKLEDELNDEALKLSTRKDTIIPKIEIPKQALPKKGN